MKTKLLIAILALPMFFAAQSTSAQNIPADTLKSMLIKDWERAKAYTNEYLDAMPNNKYSYKPNDSIRTFAQQMLHLVQANNFLVMTATGEMPTFGGRDLEKNMSAQIANSVRFYVDKSYDFAISAIQKMSPAMLLEMKSVNMGQEIKATRLGWLMKAFEHQTHHRGQTTIYLRSAGYRPPQEKLF